MIYAFILYLVVLFIIGILTSKLTKTLEDFVLGGRKLGAWIIALSEKATDFSAWLLIGLPGQAFKMGLGALWAGIGCFIGSLFNWTVIATPLRKLSEKYNALTLPDYFESRFNDKTRILRITSFILIIIFFTFYISAQISGSGKILSSAFGISPIYGMIIGIGMITFYTMLGGFFAVAITDFIQALLMLSALLILPILGIINLGGIGKFIEISKNVKGTIFSLSGGEEGLAMVLGVIIGGLAIGLGYPGQPHIVARYMAIKSEKEIKKATIISMTWTFFALTGAISTGIVGIPILAGKLKDPEHITSMLAKNLLNPFIAGIIISGAISAVMSTVDSQLLVVTSCFVEDIYKKMINPEEKQEKLVIYSRILTFLISLVAFILALKAQTLVYWLVLYAWGGLAASFGPPLILSILWKRTTKWGIFAGMIGGAITIILWYNIPFLKKLIYELVPGFFFSLFLCIIFSLLTKKEE
jgi:sodium/proline symporter